MKSSSTTHNNSITLMLDIEIVAKTDAHAINNLEMNKVMKSVMDTTVNTLMPTFTSTVNNQSLL